MLTLLRSLAMTGRENNNFAKLERTHPLEVSREQIQRRCRQGRTVKSSDVGWCNVALWR